MTVLLADLDRLLICAAQLGNLVYAGTGDYLHRGTPVPVAVGEQIGWLCQLGYLEHTDLEADGGRQVTATSAGRAAL